VRGRSRTSSVKNLRAGGLGQSPPKLEEVREEDALDGRAVDLADAGAREELLRVRGERHLGEGVLVARRDASLGRVETLKVTGSLEAGEELGPVREDEL